MGNIGFLKRALPFLGTFALGLFVASFFVSISPRFEHHERGRCHHEMWQMRIENEQLREENTRLQEQLDSAGIGQSDEDSLPAYPNEDWIPPSVDQPVLPPPPAPMSHKLHVR